MDERPGFTIWTTPQFEFLIEGYDLSGADVEITFEQYRASGVTLVNLTVEPDSVAYADGASTVAITLTQQQSGQFEEGTVKVMINWLDGSDLRWPTAICELVASDNLLREVMTSA